MRVFFGDSACTVAEATYLPIPFFSSAYRVGQSLGAIESILLAQNHITTVLETLPSVGSPPSLFSVSTSFRSIMMSLYDIGVMDRGNVSNGVGVALSSF